jgi:hypothetical protein
MAIKTFTTGEVLTAADTNTYLANSGLVYVGSGTLSLTTSATNVTGVFNSTFKHYRVVLDITARSTSNRFDMRYLVGTTPTSSAYYNGGIGSDFASNTTIYYQRSNNDPQIYFDTQTGAASYILDIMNPNLARGTTMHGSYASSQTAIALRFGGVQGSSTQFTGFQLFASTGTMTVEYLIYGYREG